MKRITSVRIEDMRLLDLELAVRWEHWESGVEIVAVNLGSEDIKGLLTEDTLDVIADEIRETESEWERGND